MQEGLLPDTTAQAANNSVAFRPSIAVWEGQQQIT